MPYVRDKAKQAAHYKEWRARNAEHVRQSKREYYDKNRARLLEEYRQRYRGPSAEKRRAMSRDYYERNKEKCRAYRRSKNRYHKLQGIGITDAIYLAQLARQGGGCAICGETEPNKGQKWLPIDHSHSDGHFRGVLCAQCNAGIGLFRDDPALLLRAIAYLKETESGAYGDHDS